MNEFYETERRMIWEDYKQQADQISENIRIAAEMLFHANKIGFNEMHDMAVRNLEMYTDQYRKLQDEFWGKK